MAIKASQSYFLLFFAPFYTVLVGQKSLTVQRNSSAQEICLFSHFYQYFKSRLFYFVEIQEPPLVFLGT